MSEQREKSLVLTGSLIAAGAIAVTLVLPVTHASAGILDLLFGGFRRAAPSAPPPAAPFVSPFADPSGNMEGSRRESGPSMAYCVRLCDGHPFPMQSGNASTAQACASMCPAAQTKIFAGAGIDYAVSPDGKRYADLPNAFVYRKQIVGNCTCNGRTAGGLVHSDAASDPTLRPGDIVATNQGLMSYRGGTSRNDFTPVRDGKLAAVKIRPAPISRSALTANARADDDRRRAQSQR